ncbi:MAG: hypothetical protein K0S29_345 [Gammaproteobacteria bacterium]|jgi:capsular polysaccharide biosynthesis protein|nr:hypothetical protein [Gammaproteobacteria bacterium]
MDIYQTVCNAIKYIKRKGQQQLRKKLCFTSVREALDNGKIQGKIIKQMTQPSQKAGGVTYFYCDGARAVTEIAKVEMPDYYIAKLKSAYALAHSGFLIQGTYLLDDNKEQITKHDALSKHPDKILSFDDKTILLNAFPKGEQLEKAISLFEDWQGNYYHWLLETLPKLMLIKDEKEFADYPLLVPGDLPQQFYESLEFMTDNKRQLIKLAPNKLHYVKQLIYSSNLSVINQAYHRKIKHDDCKVSFAAVNYVRQNCQKLMSKHAPQRLLYIERNSGYRQVLNEDEVKQLVLSYGFEMIDCAKLNFYEQVNLFSQAKLIIGPSGASFANLIFCAKGARALTFTPGTCRETYEPFGPFSEILGIKLAFLQGVPKEPANLHSDYRVNCAVLGSLIKEMLSEESL